MPQMTNMLVRSDVDGLANHTFIPARDVPNPLWRTNVAGIPVIGQSTYEVQWEAMKNGKTKVNCKLAVPIMEVVPAGTVNSEGRQAGPAVADLESVSCTFFFSPRGTTDTRAEIVRMFMGIMQGASNANGGGTSPITGAAHAYRDVVNTQQVPYGLVNLLFPGA